MIIHFDGMTFIVWEYIARGAFEFTEKGGRWIILISEADFRKYFNERMSYVNP